MDITSNMSSCNNYMAHNLHLSLFDIYGNLDNFDSNF